VDEGRRRDVIGANKVVSQGWWTSWILLLAVLVGLIWSDTLRQIYYGKVWSVLPTLQLWRIWKAKFRSIGAGNGGDRGSHYLVESESPSPAHIFLGKPLIWVPSH
jgi:hypothetical protein